MISYILIIFTLFLIIYYKKQRQRKRQIKERESKKGGGENSGEIEILKNKSINKSTKKVKKYDRKCAYSSRMIISNPEVIPAPDSIKLNKPFWELPLSSAEWVTFLKWCAHAPIQIQEEFMELGINRLFPLRTERVNPSTRHIFIFNQIINHIFDEIINKI